MNGRTFGIKRLAVQMLKLAYIECRTAGRDRIELEDLHKAYRSSAYTSNAREVEELQLHIINKGSSGTHQCYRQRRIDPVTEILLTQAPTL